VVRSAANVRNVLDDNGRRGELKKRRVNDILMKYDILRGGLKRRRRGTGGRRQSTLRFGELSGAEMERADGWRPPYLGNSTPAMSAT